MSNILPGGTLVDDDGDVIHVTIICSMCHHHWENVAVAKVMRTRQSLVCGKCGAVIPWGWTDPLSQQSPEG